MLHVECRVTHLKLLQVVAGGVNVSDLTHRTDTNGTAHLLSNVANVYALGSTPHSHDCVIPIETHRTREKLCMHRHKCTGRHARPRGEV